jgi:hypothetical protein
VAPQHHDDCALFSGCLGDRRDDELEVARDQNIRESFQKRSEATVLVRR